MYLNKQTLLLLLSLTGISLAETTISSNTSKVEVPQSEDSKGITQTTIIVFAIVGTFVVYLFVRIVLLISMSIAGENSCLYKRVLKPVEQCLTCFISCKKIEIPRSATTEDIENRNSGGSSPERGSVSTATSLNLDNIKVEAGSNKKSLPAEFLCVVCIEEKRSTYFEPCMHVCCCSNCAKDVKETQKKCPLCRTDIKKIQHAYL